MRRDASTTNVAARSPEGSPTSRRSPSYTTTSLHPLAPLVLHLLLYVSFLALLKEKYKNNKTTKENPPSHSLSRAMGRRWVLASLSRPALVSTSALALARTTETRRRTGKSNVLAGHNDPTLHSQPPPSSTTRTSPLRSFPLVAPQTASCTRCSRLTIFATRPSTHVIPSRDRPPNLVRIAARRKGENTHP